MREFSLMGFEQQQIRSLATVLNSSTINVKELLADLTEYGNLKNVNAKLEGDLQRLNSQKRSLEIERDNPQDSKRLANEPLSSFFETLRFKLVRQALTVGYVASVVPEKLEQKSKVQDDPFEEIVGRDMEN